jgi:hypothetical protein
MSEAGVEGSPLADAAHDRSVAPRRGTGGNGASGLVDISPLRNLARTTTYLPSLPSFGAGWRHN